MAPYPAFKLPGIGTNFFRMNIAILAMFAVFTMHVDVEVQATLNGNCTNSSDCGPYEVCSDEPKQCICGVGNIEETESCRLPKYGESCEQAACVSPLSCVGDVGSQTCTCSSTQYYDKDALQCVNKKGLRQACDDSRLCFSQFECKTVCQCQDDEYSPDNLHCYKRKAHGAGCAQHVENECKANLTCLNDNEIDKCGCTLDTHFYDTTKFDCYPRKAEGTGCQNIPNQCSPTLSCVDGICKCSETQYYNGSQCQTRKPIGDTCGADGECNATVSCINKQCACKSTEYQQGGGCETRKAIGDTCGVDEECKASVSCINNQRCACKSTEYEQGVGCETRKAIGDTCGVDEECKASVSCINNQRCACKSTEYEQGVGCETRKPIGDTCGADGECEATVSCINKQCACQSTEYQQGGGCETKKDHTAICAETRECSDANAECLTSRFDRQLRCLCKALYYQSQTTQACHSLTYLKVQVTDTSPGTDSIVFRWTAMSSSPPALYKINVTPSGGSHSASASGGTASGLIPGTKYEINIESYIQSNANYGEKSTSVWVIPDPWTKPSKPGEYDLGQSQLMESPMTFVFTKSTGNVAKYKVSILDGGQAVTTRNVSENSLSGLDLGASKTYGYQITAINGNDDESEMRTGTFTTSAAASSKVELLEITNPTANSVDVQWRPPTSPNGQIVFFVVQVLEDDACKATHYKSCSDCGVNTQVFSSECGQEYLEGSFTTADADDLNKVFTVKVSSLTTFTDYTIKVFAVNEAGNGVSDEKTFKTNESVAESLTDLSVTSFRENSNTRVGLLIEWTPGAETGVTTYEVNVVDKKDDSLVASKTLSGYNNKTSRIQNLLGDHEYRITVTARTTIGSGPAKSEEATTKTAVPGVVTGLQIDETPHFPKRINLKFMCPQESQRNGDIQGFIVVKKVLGSETEHPVDDSDCRNEICVPYVQLGELKFNEDYNFKVITKNQDFQSNPTSPISHRIAPQVPHYEQSVVKEDANGPATKTSISVSVCSDCLTNADQGEKTHAGLIVCVKSKTNTCTTSRRKRAEMGVGEFQQYTTWAVAKSSSFDSSYRTTPDNWLTTLKNDKPSSFVIGDQKCSKISTGKTYCNGPLPSGKEIVVTVISCTEAGCQPQTSTGFVLKTKASTSSSDDSTGLIVGIVVALIVVIAVVAGAFFYMRFRRKKREDPAHVPFTDMSDPHRKPIKIRDFKDQVAVLHKDANLMFQSEFEEIKEISADLKCTSEEAQRECNRVKNRYVDILPFDHSRVKLGSSSDSEDGSDFINASYIPGFNSKREYIATQGPMHATIPHFWRMVWEQKSKVIVMLSDLMENNRMKVNLYWPENLNEPISCGDVVVEMTNFSQLNKYIIRNFKISVGNVVRRVTHFFIPGWWDFSANLTFDDVLEFAQLVRKETTPPDSGPPIVHCSAGVGRTGTFIALDYFMQYIECHSLDDTIDVFEYVLEMRKNRPRMVQAETQYVFIFDALVEVIQRKRKSEEERLYDNLRPMEENVYANQVEPDHIYANANITDKDTDTNTTTVDFSYANQAFEPDGNFESVDLSSSNKPTTVL